MDYVSEAEALYDIEECGFRVSVERDIDDIDIETVAFNDNVRRSTSAKKSHNNNYKANKSAKVGEEIICPICHKKFIKRQYSQAFCCNDCKNKFHNRRGDRHRDNYYAEYDKKDIERALRRIKYSI